MLQCALAASLPAQDSVESLFPARPAGHLTDVARIVPGEVAARIEAGAAELRRTTGAEIAVVTLPTLGRFDRAEVAVAIGRRWGVGAAAEVGDARRNAGLVVLLVPRTDSTAGQFFIATGRGLEGAVTDLVSARIRDDARPLFQAGDYGGGLELVVRRLGEAVRGELGADSARGDRALRPPPSAPLGRIVPLLVLIVIAMAVSSARGGRRRHWRGGRRGRRGPDWIVWTGGGGFGGGGGGGWGGLGGGGDFGGFGGGGGFSGGGAGGDF